MLALTATLAGCGTSNGVVTSNSSASQANTTGSSVNSLTGAGSTFDYPFFNKAFYVYGSAHNLQVNYQSIGSGGGIQQFTAQTVNFGASDVPMNSTEISKAQAAGGPVIQIPITLGGEAIAYNLPTVKQQLKFTPSVLADIYLGKITKWNDPKITALNPGANLPSIPIVVVHRSDGSGTTYIFTDYLSTVSPEWNQKVGKGKSVNWPVGIGGKGNEAVAGNVHNTVGAIGYVELAYALQTKMAYGLVKNAAGNFVAPSPDTVKAAAATKPTVSATNFSIVNAPGGNSYPISGYSWVLLYQHQKNKAIGSALVKLFDWMETTGQQQAASVDYVPLPTNVQQTALNDLKQIQ
ncbi:phosphate ABC transporter substrate-binding protein PstS [Alicyclobacillus curvatus]|nr:phosphate ABC transporter substrate-binding protein PstS [Alicyclobacillus curvatus]